MGNTHYTCRYRKVGGGGDSLCCMAMDCACYSKVEGKEARQKRKRRHYTDGMSLSSPMSGGVSSGFSLVKSVSK